MREIEVTLSRSGPRYVSPDLEFAVWSATLGDAFIAGTLLLLFIEVVKATGAKSAVDHVLSLLVFGGAAAEFLLVQQAANSTFAILTVICFVDLIAGLFIRLRVSRRERQIAADAADARS